MRNCKKTHWRTRTGSLTEGPTCLHLFVLLAWDKKKGIICFKKRTSSVSDILAHSLFISTAFLFLSITFQASVTTQPFMSAVRNSICNIIGFQILTSVVLRFLAVSITATDLTKYILGTSVVLHMSFPKYKLSLYTP